MNSADIRCGAVIGDDFGIALGALAYYASNLVDYSVYGFGRAFETGVVAGSANAGSTYTENTQIGLGIYGGVMGGWIRGLAYGAHVKGDAYSLYVDGNTYVNKPITELVTTLDENRVPAYSITSLSTELLTKGKAIIENGSIYIRFESNFANLVSANPEDVIITVTPTSSSSGVYISQQDALGFTVKENISSGQPVQINWIAMGTRLQTMTHSPEVVAKDFDGKMNGVMFNENNTGEKGQPIWWDGTRVRFDNPPPKVPDPKAVQNTRFVPNNKGIQ
jgi:hypothetical protein